MVFEVLVKQVGLRSNVEVALYIGFYTFSELLGMSSTSSEELCRRVLEILHYLKLCIGLAGYLVCNNGDVWCNLICICKHALICIASTIYDELYGALQGVEGQQVGYENKSTHCASIGCTTTVIFLSNS